MARRISIILTAMALLFCLCGCSSGRVVAGEEYILAARKAYRALDSARVDVINDDTGISEQIFIYKYDEKDVMTYSYIGSADGLYIAQYNNGYEQFTEENGKITMLTPADIEFASYSRDVPYPYADEGLILFMKDAVVDELSYIAQNEDAMEVCHVYDITKLGRAETDERMTGFKVKYYFDGEGNLLFLKEITDMTLEDGTKKSYSYSVYITQRNEIETVPNAIKVELPEYSADEGVIV